jgi:hypothetical protein|tara:strand:+ start:9617 stop:9805 length:189 start_codon:yes stop_codon:yes gene_type:complete
LRHFTKARLLRAFCLEIDPDITDEMWAKVSALPKPEWSEEKVKALLKPKKSKKVKKDGDKEE